MAAQKKNSEAWFFDLLKKAGEVEIDRLLASDEAFEAFLKANPLSHSEEVEIRDAVERMAARFRGQPHTQQPSDEECAPVEEPAEFTALHRNQGNMSAEVEKRLEELRARVKAKPKSRGGRKRKESGRNERSD